MWGIGPDTLLGRMHGHRMAFHQDFASRRQSGGPIGVPGLAGGILPSLQMASHRGSARGGNRAAGIRPAFLGAADDPGFREPNHVNDVALPDKQGLILRVSLYILLA